MFAGPFDLLLTLILREEIDLLEVDLAEVVVSYIDHLEQRGELDLEAATEFLVLIAALLELKSRLLLPGEEQEIIELDPGEAAEELLARLLDAHRYRAAANHLQARLAEQSGYRFRSAPLPPSLRRASLQDAAAVYAPDDARRARSVSCCACPSRSTCATSACPRSRSPSGWRICEDCLLRGRFSFDDAVARADRVTVAVTLFALLELYKQGEATWIQGEPFGEITVEATPSAARRQTVGSGMTETTLTTTDAELERTIESLLFLSSEPVSAEALADATGEELHEVVTAVQRLREHYEFERRGLVLRELGGGYALSSHPDSEPAARRLLARPRTPPLTPAQAETLAIIAYLQPVSRPEIARIRGVGAESAAATLLERGVIEESGRSQFGAVLYRTTELFLRLFGLNSLDELPDIKEFDPEPELEQELRERLLKAGEARAGG